MGWVVRRSAAAFAWVVRRSSSSLPIYHRVLSRAAWSPLAASRVLLGLLLAAFVPTGPIVLAIDETLGQVRRRWWRALGCAVSRRSPDPTHSTRRLLHRLTHALSYAA